MRLFHVSEESDISKFLPRLPMRKDLDPTVGLVWAIDERHLPNFLTPRNCPRVCYLRNGNTTQNDIRRFLPQNVDHVVVIEQQWLERLHNTVLYLYEFDPKDFVLQDEVAGYYVSTKMEMPIRKIVVSDLAKELASRGVQLVTADNLCPIAEEIRQSSFDWSLCRMGYAQKRQDL